MFQVSTFILEKTNSLIKSRDRKACKMLKYQHREASRKKTEKERRTNMKKIYFSNQDRNMIKLQWGKSQNHLQE